MILCIPLPMPLPAPATSARFPEKSSSISGYSVSCNFKVEICALQETATIW